MASKLFIVSVVVLGVAVILGCLYPQELRHATFSPINPILSLISLAQRVARHDSEKANKVNNSPTEFREKMFTPEELAAFTENPILLGLLGKVYDVTKGVKHYGPDGGYQFFAGRDASRAFVTGDFTESGLADDIAGLTPSEALEVLTWQKFYDDEYTYVGKLQGTYYDESGRPTQKLKAAQRLIAEGEKEKAAGEADRKMFPPCNSQWSQKTGSRLWCSNLSGGISRSWVGVPRKYFKPGVKSFRCACVPPEQLANPHFKLYEECDPAATSCKLAKKDD